MGRGRSFSQIEENLLQDNYDKTITELEAIFLDNGYVRSRKSINRKLEKMRNGGDIGFRSKDTVKRSYKQRSRKPGKADTADNWGNTGDNGFDTGAGWNDLE